MSPADAIGHAPVAVSIREDLFGGAGITLHRIDEPGKPTKAGARQEQQDDEDEHSGLIQACENNFSLWHGILQAFDFVVTPDGQTPPGGKNHT